MTRDVRTTSLNVCVSDECAYLDSRYNLVCYSVPTSFKSGKGEEYGRLHIEIKSQLTYPYYFLPHALSIYVLYPTKIEPVPLTLSFLDDKELTYSHIPFSDLELHVLLKLLFADYFRKPVEGRFVSQGNYYIYVKTEQYYRTGELKWDMCLKIEVNGHRDNKGKEATQSQSFQISYSATRFRITDRQYITDWTKNNKPYYYRTSPQDGMVYFNQLRKEEIDDFTQDIFTIYRDSKHPARLEYHNHTYPEYCSGKVLYDFISNFITYLKSCGLDANQQYRQVEEFSASKRLGELNLVYLPLVNLLDERVSTDNPIEDYLELLQTEYSDIQFNLIDTLSSSLTNPPTPTLILLDATQEDFGENGLLSDFGDDPYQIIYSNEDYTVIPKQTINVNIDGGNWKGEDPFDYLEYSVASFTARHGKVFKYKVDVALKELLQKDFVINPRDVIGTLPGFSDDDIDLRQFAFVRKKTYTNIGNFWVLLYCENNQLHFVDLQSSSARQKLYEVADGLGLDWDDVYEELCQKRFKSSDDDKLLRYFDVVLAPNLAVEIEDIKETVLYEYDKIIARQNIRQKEFPLDYFRLQHRYDDAKTGNLLTLDQLNERGLLNGNSPKGNKERSSVELYNQFGAFDEFLDELEMDYIEISFDTLTNETNMETIGKIFGLKKDKKTEKYSRRKLYEMYKRSDILAGDKQKDVHLYQGIWYDAEHRFMVGSKDALSDTQPNAHKIRQFDILVGNQQFNIEMLLQTMAVTFVRHKQYTVIPYLFHLIDIYVENVLRWQDD